VMACRRIMSGMANGRIASRRVLAPRKTVL
jgi:hypothetical protein